MSASGPVHEGETPTRKLAGYELVPPSTKRVLDVGCGAGEDVLALAERLGGGCLVVGLDVALDKIDEAQRLLRNVALNVRFAVGDARSLPFQDESFDVVRTEALFSEVTERARVVRELSRVVAPGGRVLIHDAESAVLSRSEGEDDLLGLMRRAGLVGVEISHAERLRPGVAGPRHLTLMGIKPVEAEPRAFA